MDQKILFKYGIQAEYDTLGSGRSEDTLFFITDTQRLYRGDLLMAVGKDVSTAASGLMSPAQYVQLQNLIAEVANRTVQKIETEKGISELKNEADGGGIFYTEKGSTGDEISSYIGTNDGSMDGLYAQIYVDKKENGKWVGTRINAYEDAIYYTNLAAKQAGVANNDPDYEIAVKKDIDAISIPEYSLTKESDPGDYAAIYHLTKDGVSIGEAINIAKDQLLKSVEVKTCTQKDVPVEGLEVGDKYLDFTFIVEKGVEAHTYIAIKDMAKPYTAGEGIIITSDNAITFDPEVLSTIEYVDANISDTMTYVIQEDNEEKAARIAGDNLKVDKELQGTAGKSYIFNEKDGGGSKFEGSNKVVSYVGTHDSIGGEIGAQIYVDKANGTESTIIDVTQNGAYYTKGTILPGAQRDVADNEIATKKDVADGAPKWEPIA